MAAPARIDARLPHRASCANQFNMRDNNSAPGIPADVGDTVTCATTISTFIGEPPFRQNDWRSTGRFATHPISPSFRGLSPPVGPDVEPGDRAHLVGRLPGRPR